MKSKYIFVIGGVMSGVGKGIATSSLGLILKTKGYKVNLVKADPYLNVDAGTMNPTEHGEVFVMKEGLETDQDMGNYERFLNQDISQANYMTSGMVYKAVIDRERALGYGGKCVEAIPHVRDEIINRFQKATKENGSDITIVEIGGTIGDFQNAMFMEAAKTMKLQSPKDVIVVVVSYLPTPGAIGEMKSKPTQNAVRELNCYGLHPDFIIARSEVALDAKRKEKISISCNVPIENVISAPDIKSIYDVPVNFEKDKIGELVLKSLSLKNKKPDAQSVKLWSDWKNFVKNIHSNKIKNLRIAMIGKYFDTGDFTLTDSYLSVIEALKFAATKAKAGIEIEWVDSKTIEKNHGILKDIFKRCNGLIVPGGFGTTGVDGILKSIEFVRKNKIPYLGICYGMQLAVIEYAQNVLGLKDAHTTEINKNCEHKIIDIMESQKENLVKLTMGGSMRLGSFRCKLLKGSIVSGLYKADIVTERHRHRYEVNNSYVFDLEKKGLLFSGKSIDGKLMEMIELGKSIHPFFVATQSHPEFLSRPTSSHPLFDGLVRAMMR
ncbi:CTP synthase [Arenimonas sp.]|nr:CTP synthase [Candidatus Parcubacteria bacterium]